MLKVTCFAQKCDFGPQFVLPVGSKMQPLGHNSHPKDLKCEVPRTTLDVLGATWATSGPKIAQVYVFIDSRVDFEVILCFILGIFGFDFGAI